AATGETKRVQADAFPNLRLAELRVDAQAWQKKPIEVEVSFEALGEAEDGRRWTSSTTEAGAFVVLACPLRMRIAAVGEPLGAFVEDVAFAPGAKETRSIVLAPGSDVVRIAGGTFVSGPPAAELARWRRMEREEGM